MVPGGVIRHAGWRNATIFFRPSKDGRYKPFFTLTIILSLQWRGEVGDTGQMKLNATD